MHNTVKVYINEKYILRAMQIMQQVYQDGKKILAIRMNEKDCKLEVNVYDNRNVPGLLIGLVLEDGALKGEKKHLRRLLHRNLGTWCDIGGFAIRVAILATEVRFYPLTADNADATFDFIITRLATKYDIPEVEPQPKSKKLKATLVVKVREKPWVVESTDLRRRHPGVDGLYLSFCQPTPSNPETLERLRHSKGKFVCLYYSIS